MRAFALALALTVPGLAFAGIGDPLDQRVRTDFFTFFNWIEGSREAAGDSTVVHFVQAPKSRFYEQVTLDVTIDGQGNIRVMRLRCLRAFVDASGGIFSKDVISSFLAESGGDATMQGTWDGDWLTFEVGGANKPSKPPLSDSQWHDLFLTEIGGMKMTQDSRDGGPDQNDFGYVLYGCERTGFDTWMSDDLSAAAWRVVEVHTVCKDAGAARAYHEFSLETASEGAPPVANPPAVGEALYVYGGTRHQAILDADMTDYYELFVTGRVVTKIYVAEGPGAAPGTLTPAIAAEIARKSDERIKAMKL